MEPIEIILEDNLLFSEEQRKSRYILVTCMFKDYPLHYSQNFRTPRNKLFFGYAQVMYGDYVFSTIPLEYDGQIVYEFRNDLAQINAFIDCAVYQIRDLIIASHNLQLSASPLVPIDNPQPMVLGCPATHIRFSVIRGASIIVETYADPVIYCSLIPPPIIPPDLPPPEEEGDILGANPPSISDGTGEPNNRGGIRPKPPEDEEPPPPPPPPDGTIQKVTIISQAASPPTTNPVMREPRTDEYLVPTPITVEVVTDELNNFTGLYRSYIHINSGGQRYVSFAGNQSDHVQGTYSYVISYSDP